MKIRALIADDEPLTRERIRMLLRSETDVEIVGECADGLRTIEFLRNNPVDLLFLDVQMPEADGFKVVEEIGVERMPTVVFCTAYDQYALRAFEVNAIEYLLKPLEVSRFRKAVQRARGEIHHVRADGINEQLKSLGESLQRERKKYLNRVAIRTADRVLLFRQEELDWVEATGNYVTVHIGQSSYLLRESMQALELRLDPARFARIHRSAIVNLDRIGELRPLFHGDYAVFLQNGRRLTLSRRYKERLSSDLRKFL